MQIEKQRTYMIYLLTNENNTNYFKTNTSTSKKILEGGLFGGAAGAILGGIGILTISSLLSKAPMDASRFQNLAYLGSGAGNLIGMGTGMIGGALGMDRSSAEKLAIRILVTTQSILFLTLYYSASTSGVTRIS